MELSTRIAIDFFGKISTESSVYKCEGVFDMRNNKTKAGDFEIRKSTFTDWGTVLQNPGKIKLEVLHAGNVPGTVHKMMELSEEQKKEYEDRKMKAPLFAHLIRHEKYGDFLIDSGFDGVYSEKPWGHFKGLIAKKVIRYSVEKGKSIEYQLEQRGVELKGVFCTHFHEHQGGAPSLPDDIPFVYGKGEKEFNLVPIIYTRFLENKIDRQAIDFENASEMPITGRTVDIFGDGSLWVIDTPGHTKGHVSYLVNGFDGQYVITGDICMCLKSYELGLESGSAYAWNQKINRESFIKIKKLLETYPQLKPIFGHETEEFRIVYK